MEEITTIEKDWLTPAIIALKAIEIITFIKFCQN
jgi:hypothetical protein